MICGHLSPDGLQCLRPPHHADEHRAGRYAWERAQRINPIAPPGTGAWEHFACPKCGNVWKLPAEPDEQGPWCCHGGNYRWNDPYEGSELGWTRTIRVDVIPRV